MILMKFTEMHDMKQNGKKKQKNELRLHISVHFSSTTFIVNNNKENL